VVGADDQAEAFVGKGIAVQRYLSLVSKMGQDAE